MSFPSPAEVPGKSLFLNSNCLGVLRVFFWFWGFFFPVVLGFIPPREGLGRSPRRGPGGAGAEPARLPPWGEQGLLALITWQEVSAWLGGVLFFLLLFFFLMFFTIRDRENGRWRILPVGDAVRGYRSVEGVIWNGSLFVLFVTEQVSGSVALG